MTLRETSATPFQTSPPVARHVPPLALVAAAVGGLGVAAAVVMWLHFGTAVFFEMLAAGLAACF